MSAKRAYSPSPATRRARQQWQNSKRLKEATLIMGDGEEDAEAHVPASNGAHKERNGEVKGAAGICVAADGDRSRNDAKVADKDVEVVTLADWGDVRKAKTLDRKPTVSLPPRARPNLCDSCYRQNMWL